eukprot:CCRYP_014435-RA/>CCRYP_014435-RA protein AED:0.14 eAED:0.08 QI:0/0/0/1/1/1/5/0/482
MTPNPNSEADSSAGIAQTLTKPPKERMAMMSISLPSDFESTSKTKLAESSSGKFFTQNNPKLVPSFDRGVIVEGGQVRGDELTVGKILGTGAFCEVREISAITLQRLPEAPDHFEATESFIPQHKRLSTTSVEGGNDSHEVDEAGFPVNGIFTTKEQIRKYMSTYCLRRGDDEEDKELHARYALKQLKVTDDEKKIRQGLIDLSIEAQFLACLNHPNIIKMRGLAGKPFSPDFGIVLDRLYMTLEDKIDFWKEEKKNALGKSLCGCLGIGLDKVTRDGLKFQAIAVAYDLSCAMRYIAGHNLVYRDTKPQNAGFDLFDFGFIKELTKNLYDKDSGQYNLTPHTGSMPYMSPEVLTGKPYGKPSDVFSFGVLLWEMFHQKFAFYHFDRRDYVDVVVRRNYRPPIDHSLPIMIRTIIKESWDEDPAKRPTFERIAILLKAEYQAMASGAMLGHSERLIDKSARSFRAHLRNADERLNEAIGEAI